jgi:hypothetical protein
VSWKDNDYSPLYRPGQAFQEETSNTLPALAMSFCAIAALGVLLVSASDGFAAGVGTVLLLLGAVVGGGSYTLIQLRAHYRRSAARRKAANPSED